MLGTTGRSTKQLDNMEKWNEVDCIHYLIVHLISKNLLKIIINRKPIRNLEYLIKFKVKIIPSQLRGYLGFFYVL